MENNNFGQVKISNDVVATIAGLAALEVEGVETNTTFTDKILKNENNVILVNENNEILCLDVYNMLLTNEDNDVLVNENNEYLKL